MRIIKRYDNDAGEWIEIEWSTVTSGTIVSIFEEDETPVPDGTGVVELNVISDAYQQTVISGGELIWHIDIADPDPTAVPRRQE